MALVVLKWTCAWCALFHSVARLAFEYDGIAAVNSDFLCVLAVPSTKLELTLAVVTGGEDDHERTVSLSILMPALTPTTRGYIHVATIETTIRLGIDMLVSTMVSPQIFEYLLSRFHECSPTHGGSWRSVRSPTGIPCWLWQPHVVLSERPYKVLRHNLASLFWLLNVNIAEDEERFLLGAKNLRCWKRRIDRQRGCFSRGFSRQFEVVGLIDQLQSPHATWMSSLTGIVPEVDSNAVLTLWAVNVQAG